MHKIMGKSKPAVVPLWDFSYHAQHTSAIIPDAMTHAEQHELIADLMDYMSRMSRSDEEMFDMFQKRDHDDEDLDELSRRKLLDLHAKYVRSRH